MSTIDKSAMKSTIDDIADRLERIERMWADLVDILGIGAANLDECSLSAEPCGCIAPAEAGHRAGCTERPHTLEQARWVAKGDIIQATHGDPMWETVVSTVHADKQTGIVTATADGTTRLRWWAHRDLVKVAAAPVPDPTPFQSWLDSIGANE